MRTIAPDRVGCRSALAPFTLALGLLLSSTLPACADSRGTIGAVMAQDDQSGRLFVREVPPNLAAARAGIKAGDEILLVDGVDVRAMDTKQIHRALEGDIDTTVKLTVVRGDGVLRVTLRRTEAQKILGGHAKSADAAP
jgi:C-terminal processing protease CtpA/Prc